MGPTDVQDENLVEIERLLPGGFGLAHAEGLTLFVGLAAPSDILRVKIERKRGSVGFASIVEVVKPSPLRVEPPCPYFGLCGGCDFQQLEYEAQLAAKVEIIRDCLHRIARIEKPPDIVMVPSPTQWQYRSRANWQFDPKARRLGYFARGSHDVCDVEVCAVLSPELQQTLERLREQMREGTLSKKLTDIEAVAGDDDVSLASADARLATLGAALVFFISSIFPVQFDREWITLGWAIEGVGLLLLFRLIPNRRLRAFANRCVAQSHRRNRRQGFRGLRRQHRVRETVGRPCPGQRVATIAAEPRPEPRLRHRPTALRAGSPGHDHFAGKCPGAGIERHSVGSYPTPLRVE